MPTFNIRELDLTVGNSPGTIVDADGDGITIITRDDLTIRIDGALADRIVAEQTAQRARETALAVAS
jgi:hypothetical protein